MQEEQKDFKFDGYYEYWNDADKKAYSRTLIYTKEKPLNITYGINGEAYNDEGRIIVLEYDHFFFVNVYVPNARKNYAGWRIGYFVVSNRIKEDVKEAGLMNDIFGSDHCPVQIELDI